MNLYKNKYFYYSNIYNINLKFNNYKNEFTAIVKIITKKMLDKVFKGGPQKSRHVKATSRRRSCPFTAASKTFRASKHGFWNSGDLPTLTQPPIVVMASSTILPASYSFFANKVNTATCSNIYQHVCFIFLFYLVFQNVHVWPNCSHLIFFPCYRRIWDSLISLQLHRYCLFPNAGNQFPRKLYLSWLPSNQSASLPLLAQWDSSHFSWFFVCLILRVFINLQIELCFPSFISCCLD